MGCSYYTVFSTHVYEYRSSRKSEFSKDLDDYLLKKLEEYLEKPPPPRAAPESDPAMPPSADGAEQKSASKGAKESAKTKDAAPNDVKAKDDGEEPPAPAPDGEEHDTRRQLSVDERRQVEQWLKWMKTVLSVRRMVTLYSLHSEAGIDGSILEALFKSRTSSLHRQLELAIHFNRLDMAHEYVLAEDSSPHVGAFTWRSLLRLKPRSPIGTASRHGVQMLSDDDPLNRFRKVPTAGCGCGCLTCAVRSCRRAAAASTGSSC